MPGKGLKSRHSHGGPAIEISLQGGVQFDLGLDPSETCSSMMGKNLRSRRLTYESPRPKLVDSVKNLSTSTNAGPTASVTFN